MRIWKNKIHRAEPGALRGRHLPRRVPPVGEAVLLRAGRREEAERMDRYLVISSDCHAGLPPERYRDYLDPQVPRRPSTSRCRSSSRRRARRRRSSWSPTSTRSGARAATRRSPAPGTTTQRVRVLDGDGIAGEVIFPDGITEMNMPPFGAGLSLPTDERSCPSCSGPARAPTTAGSPSSARWRPSGAPASRSCRCCWDVDEAVQEVRWARAHGLRGILIPSLLGQARRLSPPAATSRSGRPARSSTWSCTSTRARRRSEDYGDARSA